MQEVLLILDIGTSKVKVGLVNTHLEIIYSSQRSTGIFISKSNMRDVDMIMDTIVSLISEAAGYIENIKICGINISGQMGGVIGIDKQGVPLTDFDSGIDMKSENFNYRLHQILGTEVQQTTCGSPRNTPKIMWWKEMYPDVYDQIVEFIPLHTFVIMQLAGASAKDIPIDYTMLAFFGNEDARALTWSESLTRELHLDMDKFPNIIDPCSVVGTLQSNLAKACGLTPGIPLYAGLGDQAAGLLGAGFGHSDNLFAILGSTTLLFSGSQNFIPDLNKRIMYIPAVFGREYYPFTYINGAGLSLQWFAENYSSESCPQVYSRLSEEASHLIPGSDSLLFIPYLGGRQCPYSLEMAGSWLGLKWKHTQAHLFRSILESIAYSFTADIYHMKNLFHKDYKSILCTGGGAEDRLWTQIIADVSGYSVQVNQSYHSLSFARLFSTNPKTFK